MDEEKKEEPSHVKAEDDIKKQTQTAFAQIFDDFNSERESQKQQAKEIVEGFEKLIDSAYNFDWQLSCDDGVFQLPAFFEWSNHRIMLGGVRGLAKILEFLVRHVDMHKELFREQPQTMTQTAGAQTPVSPIQVTNIIPQVEKKEPWYAALRKPILPISQQEQTSTPWNVLNSDVTVTNVIHNLRQIQPLFVEFLDWVPKTTMFLEAEMDPKRNRLEQARAIAFLWQVSFWVISGAEIIMGMKADRLNEDKRKIAVEWLKAQQPQKGKQYDVFTPTPGPS